jgi:hypothetical protein
MLLCRPLQLQSPARRLPPSPRPPPPLTALLLLLLALLVANTGTQPLKLQPLCSSPHTIPSEALLQRGQHGNVTVSFIKPANGSVVPLSSSGSSGDHEAHVTVQLQILNMWFEGARPHNSPAHPLNRRPAAHRRQPSARVGPGQQHWRSKTKPQTPYNLSSAILRSLSCCSRCVQPLADPPLHQQRERVAADVLGVSVPSESWLAPAEPPLLRRIRR